MQASAMRVSCGDACRFYATLVAAPSGGDGCGTEPADTVATLRRGVLCVRQDCLWKMQATPV